MAGQSLAKRVRAVTDDRWAAFAALEAEAAAATHIHADRDREILVRARRWLEAGEDVPMWRHRSQIVSRTLYVSGHTTERTAWSPDDVVRLWREGYR